jgi:2-succinyl-5-enolpyruvyl-6-hydroxy-3-cyclohexene-1-carboxylate synthase
MTGVAAIAAENARRADDVVAALVRHGIEMFWVCPGSRSTPLVLALERHGLRTEVLLDERVAGFAALGAGRVGLLAAVVTTSGTAVANLLPACAEAARDGVPLACVTADRSDDDVAAGASQSLSQPPLLAGCVRAIADLPAPDGVTAPDVDAVLDDVLAHLVGPGAGPVHVNVRFNKPLEPPPGWHSSLRGRSSSSSSSPSLSYSLSPSLPSGVVVVGALPHPLRAAAGRLLARLGWPVIVDVGSGVVVPPSVPRLPTVALRSAAVREALTPAGVLWLGGLMTEDATATWVASLRRRGTRVVQLSGTAVRRDPFALMDEVHVVAPDVLDVIDVIDGIVCPRPAPDPDLVRQLESVAAAVTTSLVDVGSALDEPGLARLVTQAARPGSFVFVGNSMPIRDVDRFGAPLLDGVELLVNRGVAGIDGNLATALGASLASKRPGLVLLGDLAALHDLSGLAAIASARAPLRIVVINNAGGGIFSFLPVEGAVTAATHERYWGTPHGHALMPVARALGIAADLVDDVDALRVRLAAGITAPELLEVRTNRADNVTRHRDLDRVVESACARALS